MILSEIVRKVWTTDEHGSRYVFQWGRPSAWALGLVWDPPHDSGGCYDYKRDAAGELVRVDYTHRTWMLEAHFLWRGFYLIRVKQRPVPRS